MMGFVWITGTNGAMGSALARRLDSSGIPLVLAARGQKKLEQLTDALQPFSVPVYPVDVIDRSSTQLVVEAGVVQFGAPIGLVHCVESIIIRSLHSTSEDDLKRVLDTNFFSAWNVLRLFVQQAVHRRVHASTALVGSAAVTVGFPNHEAVASMKAAVTALTQSAATAYADRSIRVNYTHPGLTSSAMSS